MREVGGSLRSLVGVLPGKVLGHDLVESACQYLQAEMTYAISISGVSFIPLRELTSAHRPAAVVSITFLPSIETSLRVGILVNLADELIINR
jgi:hypothetical protein